jgi:hypothetical protein
VRKFAPGCFWVVWFWGFGVFIFLVWVLVFCRGFLKKAGAERGFFVVSLWWDRGDLWTGDGRFFGVEDLPLFGDLFFRIPILGMDRAPRFVVG